MVLTLFANLETQKYILSYFPEMVEKTGIENDIIREPLHCPVKTKKKEEEEVKKSSGLKKIKKDK